MESGREGVHLRPGNSRVPILSLPLAGQRPVLLEWAPSGDQHALGIVLRHGHAALSLCVSLSVAENSACAEKTPYSTAELSQRRAAD